MKTISIVGFGRFGKTLYRLLKGDFSIVLFNRSEINPNEIDMPKETRITKDISEIYKCDVTFFAVPISSFDSVIKEHKKYFKPENLLIDVLSVKMHPKMVFDKYLKGTKTKALLTHPMFGPDSSRDGFNNLPIVMDKYTSSEDDYNFWKDYFSKKELRVVELSASDHDKLSAKSQALAHFIGRGLKEINHDRSIIDTKGALMLADLMDLTTNDSLELFTNLQTYNPFTKKVRMGFVKVLKDIDSKLSKD